MKVWKGLGFIIDPQIKRAHSAPAIGNIISIQHKNSQLRLKDYLII